MRGKIGSAVKKSENKEKDSLSNKSKPDFSQFEDINSPVEQVLQLQRTIGNRAVTRLIRSGILQAKLKIGQPDDMYEQEADRAAEQVMRMSEGSLVNDQWTSGRKESGSGCPECLEEEFIQTKPASGSTFEVNPGIESRIQSLKGSGQPLSQSTRNFFEPRFGADFSRVRTHQDTDANHLASSLGARAFTLGKDVWMGQGESTSDKKLMAHELTHVVQQGEINTGSVHSAYLSEVGEPGVIQKTTLEGIDDQCVDYDPRQLVTGSGAPLPPTRATGGTVVPGTAGAHQNCAGVSLCGRREYINWPFLGYEAADGVARPPNITASWDRARYFVPHGCVPVDCSGITINATRCQPEEREVITFLYRWPIGTLRGTSTMIYQSDFHMIGRTCSSLPMAWESKMDRREEVRDIRDPRQSLYDAYPHTRLPDREIVKLCFCCNCGQIRTS